MDARRRQPACFWWLLAFNIVMYCIVIPCRLL